MASLTIGNLIPDLSILGVAMFGQAGGGYPPPSGHNNSILVTNGSGVANWATVLPTGITCATPTSSTEVANKQYVDASATGAIGAGVYLTSAAALTGWIYNNGISGVGATLTAPSIGLFTIDGVQPAVGDRILYKNDVAGSGAYNGIYDVTANGSGVAGILTRSTGYDNPQEINDTGLIVASAGSSNMGKGYFLTVIVSTVGTSPLTYSSFGNSGTVTSVALALPNIFSVSGSPITSSGTLTGGYASAPLNGQIWIGNTATGQMVQTTLTPVSNQTTITNGAGSIIIGTAQNIGTSSTPSFASLYISPTPATPSYLVDIRGNTPTSSQVHINNASSDDGLYISAFSSNQGFFSAGSAYINGNWTAKSTSAMSMSIAGNAQFNIYSNTGLTIGNTFTPTAIFTIVTSGAIIAYNRIQTQNAAAATTGFSAWDTTNSTQRQLLTITAGAIPSLAIATTTNSTITIDGAVIGGTTPAAASVTTLNASSTVTLSGLTSHGALTLNSGSQVQSIAPGSSGNVLTSNGTDWVSSPAPASGVTSVGLTVNGTSPSGIFTVSGSPVTSAGTLNFNLSGTSGGIPYFSSSSVLSSSSALTASQLIIGGGAGGAPSTLAAGSQYQVLVMGASNPGYGALHLDQSAAVTGILPNANTTADSTVTASTIVLRDSNGNTQINNVVQSGVSIATTGGTTTLTANSPQTIVFTGTSAQTIKLPATSTLPNQNTTYVIINKTSAANITVQASDASVVQTVAAGFMLTAICISTSITSNAAWFGEYTPSTAYSSTPIANDIVLYDSNGNINTNAISYLSTSSTVVTSSTSSNITPNFTANSIFHYQLQGNVTLNVPTNLAQGQQGEFNFWQDGTGSRTLSYAWCYWFPAGGYVPTLSTTIYYRDQMSYMVDMYKTSTVTISIATPCQITWTSHGLITGMAIQLSTTGSLPSGLATGTTYWVYVVDANTLQLSTSLANLQAASYVFTTGSQSGTQTATCIMISLYPNLNMQV